MTNNSSVSSIHGYNLFNHIEDEELRAQNRAITLANLLEDNLYEDTKKVSDAGQQWSLEYWSAVPEEERAAVYAVLKQELIARNMVEESV